MRVITNLTLSLLAAGGLFAASAAQALDLDEPFFGGAYAPAPGYAYSRGYGEGARIGGGIGAVGYDQGYYGGGYQYPAGGYGGGPYRRGAYSAADVYVSGGYPPPYGRGYLSPYAAYRPYARGYYAPVRGYRYAPPAGYGGYYNNIGYRPYRGLRRHCQCVLY